MKEMTVATYFCTIVKLNHCVFQSALRVNGLKGSGTVCHSRGLTFTEHQNKLTHYASIDAPSFIILLYLMPILLVEGSCIYGKAQLD